MEHKLYDCVNQFTNFGFSVELKSKYERFFCCCEEHNALVRPQMPTCANERNLFLSKIAECYENGECWWKWAMVLFQLAHCCYSHFVDLETKTLKSFIANRCRKNNKTSIFVQIHDSLFGFILLYVYTLSSVACFICCFKCIHAVFFLYALK